VRARVNQIQASLPAELEIEIEQLTPSLFPVLSYNLEGGDPATLYDLARYDIKPLISRVPGVGRVDVQGSDVREIEVIADPARLAAHGLTYADLADGIRRAITVQAVGRVAQDYRQYLIVTDQEAHAAEDIGNVVVHGGLHVRDLATVQVGTEDHVRIIAGDGRPAALINVTRQLGGNSLAIADSIARIMAAVAPTLPPGVHVKPVYDQALLVREAVSSVRDAMLIGAALAVLVLLVFLRHGRITAISATSIPLTLAIIDAIIAHVGNQTFAVPQSAVQEVIEVDPDRLRPLEQNELLTHRGRALPIVRLERLFHLETTPRPRLHAIVVGTGLSAVGLVVDRVAGHREIVVKSIADPLIHVAGVSGATELGDGRLVLILDVGAMSRGVRERPRAGERSA